MFDISEVIVRNIIKTMQENSIKQVELAKDIGVSKQTMSKMLNGERMINAVELASIAKALNVSTDTLVKFPTDEKVNNPIRAFMGEVDSPEVKEGLEIADKLADLICFHVRCKENGDSLKVSWRTHNEKSSWDLFV